jgi:hypothetical protein
MSLLDRMVSFLLHFYWYEAKFLQEFPLLVLLELLPSQLVV